MTTQKGTVNRHRTSQTIAPAAPARFIQVYAKLTEYNGAGPASICGRAVKFFGEPLEALRRRAENNATNEYRKKTCLDRSIGYSWTDREERDRLHWEHP